MVDLAIDCAEWMRRQSVATLGADAEATLVFETSFTTAQGWTQDEYQNPAGSLGGHQTGFNGYGSWYLTPADYDGVITGANRAGGAGGRGFRHWRGDGTDWCGGGCKITLGSVGVSEVRELWLRYYMRYQSGFHWQDINSPSNPHFTKEVYWNVGSGTGNFVFGHNGAGWGFWLVHGGSANISTAGKDWYWMNGNSYYADGNFHCMEFHIKSESGVGISDAVGEVWVDDVLCVSRNDIRFGVGLPTDPWNEFVLGENADNPQNGGNRYVDYDDLAISLDGRIGP